MVSLCGVSFLSSGISGLVPRRSLSSIQCRSADSREVARLDLGSASCSSWRELGIGFRGRGEARLPLKKDSGEIDDLERRLNSLKVDALLAWGVLLSIMILKAARIGGMS